MLFDTHTHTSFSFDSSMAPEDAIAAARKMNVGLCFTEHIDLNFNIAFDWQAYRKDYEGYRQGGVLLGTEVGFDKDTANASNEFVKNSAPDFILGSQHCVQGLDIYDDKTFQTIPEKEFWQNYFQEMKDNIKSHSFIDSLAHWDFPLRRRPYGKDRVADLGTEEFLGGLEPVLRELISRDISFELNLRRFSRETMADFEAVYGLYGQLGGCFVTLGSDAHGAALVGQKFQLANEFLNRFGLTPCHYKNHQRIVDKT